MITPYGPVINLGTADEPNFAGAGEAVAYMRGIIAARDAIKAAEGTWGPPALDVVEALLPK